MWYKHIYLILEKTGLYSSQSHKKEIAQAISFYVTFFIINRKKSQFYFVSSIFHKKKSDET